MQPLLDLVKQYIHYNKSAYLQWKLSLHFVGSSELTKPIVFALVSLKTVTIFCMHRKLKTVKIYNTQTKKDNI